MPTLFLKATRHATPSGGYFATQTTFITRLSLYGTPRRLITQVSRVFASIPFDNNFVLHFVKTQAGDHPVYECLLPSCTWEPPPMDAALQYTDHATDRFYETVVLPLMIELMLTSGWQLSGSSTHRISDTESMESYIFFRADVPAEAKPRSISMPAEVPLPTEVLNSTRLLTPGESSAATADDTEDEPASFIPPHVPLLSSNQPR